jgi:hypothetical protein
MFFFVIRARWHASCLFPPECCFQHPEKTMPLIHILDDAFDAAPALSQLLGRRRVSAERGAKPAMGTQVVVASAVAEAKLGGGRGLAELARAAGRNRWSWSPRARRPLA